MHTPVQDELGQMREDEVEPVPGDQRQVPVAFGRVVGLREDGDDEAEGYLLVAVLSEQRVVQGVVCVFVAHAGCQTLEVLVAAFEFLKNEGKC